MIATFEKYSCYGERELIERIHNLENGLTNLVRDWDFTDSKKNQCEVIKLLDSNN